MNGTEIYSFLFTLDIIPLDTHDIYGHFLRGAKSFSLFFFEDCCSLFSCRLSCLIIARDPGKNNNNGD